MQQQTSGPHQTVLLTEAIDALVQDPAGTYVDGTFGRGGHSAAALEKLGEQGFLLAIDRDPEAISYGTEKFANEPRIEFVHAEFSNLKSVILERNLAGNLSGVLLDLGVSSPQLDEAERGFSFMREGPLDMRMNNSAGMTAADWLNTAADSEISEVLKVYGEERFARRIARGIVDARAENPLTTTRELADVIKASVPAFDKGKHPATRSFQAIRIFINRELAELETALSDVIELLAPQGRLVVISFHSLEDRLVKRFMRDASRPPRLPKEIPVVDRQAKTPLRLLGKPVYASKAEVEANPRSRSAVMRVAERVA